MWHFVAAFSSLIVDEAGMVELITRYNARSRTYVYRYRQGRGTTDWVVERSKK